MIYLRHSAATRDTTRVRWVKRVRTEAQFVWVYIPGMIEQPRRWAPSFHSLAPGSGAHCACVELWHPASTYGCTTSRRRQFRRWAGERARHLVDVIRWIQKSQPYPLGFISDDFGAHVILELARMEQPILPSFIVLSEPMVTRAELEPLAGIDGYIRKPGFPWEEMLSIWGVDVSNLARGESLPKASHLTWGPETEALGGLREAVMNPRPMRQRYAEAP